MRRLFNPKQISTRTGTPTFHRRDVQIDMKETPELRITGDPVNRMVYLDLMIGQFVVMTMDAADALREGLQNAEQAFAMFPAPGPAKFPKPVTEEMRQGVLIRVAADGVLERIVLDIAVDGKPFRWIGLSVAESQALRAGLAQVDEALRMQHV